MSEHEKQAAGGQVQDDVRLRCCATGNYDKPPIAALFREHGRYALREYRESDFGIPIRDGDTIEVRVNGVFTVAT